MRIGIIHPLQKYRGGGERVCSYFAKYLLDRGYDVTVFSETGKIQYEEIFDKKPDIRKPIFWANTNLLKTYSFMMNYNFFNYGGVDVLVDTCGYSIINSLVHECKIHYFHARVIRNGLYYVPYRLMANFLLRVKRHPEFVCNSKKTRFLMKKYLKNVKMHVIYPPVDVNKFHPINNPTEDYIFMAGRISPSKRFENALNYMEGMNVVIAGIVEDVNYFKFLRKKFPFVKFITTDKYFVRLFQNCSLYVFPTPGSLGIVPFEAMACERKVLVPVSSGSTELIKDSMNGFVYKNDSEFEKKLKEAISTDLDKKMVRKTVVDNLSVEVFGKKMEELLL